MNGTGLRLIATPELRRLRQYELDDYERAVSREASRLWAELDRVPCPVNFHAWHGFVDAWIAPVISEQSWRLIREVVSRTGPGGVEV